MPNLNYPLLKQTLYLEVGIKWLNSDGKDDFYGDPINFADLKKYPSEQLCELITIWIVLRIGKWNGYSISCLQKDFNKLLVKWEELGMAEFTPEVYEKYRQNVQKVNREYNKHIEVPPYEEWRKENFRRRFEEINIQS